MLCISVLVVCEMCLCYVLSECVCVCRCLRLLLRGVHVCCVVCGGVFVSCVRVEILTDLHLH